MVSPAGRDADVYGAGESEEVVGHALVIEETLSALTELVHQGTVLDRRLDTQLAAADVVLTHDVLDRIDEIVPPGTTINPADSSFDTPALSTAARRRG